MSKKASLVINGAECIKQNSSIYKDCLPLLIASLVSIKERADAYEDFFEAGEGGANVCYLMLAQAINTCPEKETFLPFLKRYEKRNELDFSKYFR